MADVINQRQVVVQGTTCRVVDVGDVLPHVLHVLIPQADVQAVNQDTIIVVANAIDAIVTTEQLRALALLEIGVQDVIRDII